MSFAVIFARQEGLPIHHQSFGLNLDMVSLEVESTIKAKYVKTCQHEIASSSQSSCHLAPFKSFLTDLDCRRVHLHLSWRLMIYEQPQNHILGVTIPI